MDEESRLQAIGIAIRHFEGKETAYASKYLLAATDRPCVPVEDTE